MRFPSVLKLALPLLLGGQALVAQDPGIPQPFSQACRELLEEISPSFVLLGLRVRGRKALLRVGAETIGDVLAFSPEDLLELKNFGASSLGELEAKLSQRGLKLRRARHVSLAVGDSLDIADLALALCSPLSALDLSDGDRQALQTKLGYRRPLFVGEPAMPTTVGMVLWYIERDTLPAELKTPVTEAVMEYLGGPLDRPVTLTRSLKVLPVPEPNTGESQRKKLWRLQQFAQASVPEKLAAPLNVLGLTELRMEALRAAGIHSLADLRQWTALQLNEIPGFRKGTLVENAMSSFGIPLVGPDPSIPLSQLTLAQKRGTPIGALGPIEVHSKPGRKIVTLGDLLDCPASDLIEMPNVNEVLAALKALMK